MTSKKAPARVRKKVGRYTQIEKTIPNGRRVTFRSPLEELLSDQMDQAGAKYDYECTQLKYTIPAVEHTYTPDFTLDNGIIIEAKGLFSAKDRKKMILVKRSHPELDIRIVFWNANQPIYTGSKTTNKQWADKHGFPWAHRAIPKSWMREGTEPRRKL